MRVGRDRQHQLQKRGDDLRIDWGYLYVAAPDEQGTVQRVDPGTVQRVEQGTPAPMLSTVYPQLAVDADPVEQQIGRANV